jgi:hypothetical protein
MRHRPATIEYRQGDAPDAWRPVQVDRLADGSVQVFVRFPASHCARSIARARRSIVIAALVTAVGLWAHWAIGASVAIVTLAMVGQAYGRLRVTCGAHRWVASGAGVLIERVSPGGYLRSRFVPRGRASDVRASQALGTWQVSIGGKRYLRGLDEPAIRAIADAVRDGVAAGPGGSTDLTIASSSPSA